MKIKSLAALSALCLSPVALAHEGQGTFVVQSMAPGYWICNAKVTNNGQVTSPNGTWTRTNTVQATIEGALTTPATPGAWLNATGRLRGTAHKPFALSAVTFALKSPNYDATYTIDLCTADPGAIADANGIEVTDLAAYASAVDLTNRDIDGYIGERANLKFSASSVCGNALNYDVDNLTMGANDKVEMTSEVDFVAAGIQTAPTSVQANKARYCVTRFVFSERNAAVERSNFLEGGVFTVGVTQGNR
jgi:hypothetical protein